MGGSHHVNRNNITYRKGTICRTEIERLFLATKNFNINLVQFLLPYVIISNVHGCAPKRVLHAQKITIHEGLYWHVYARESATTHRSLTSL